MNVIATCVALCPLLGLLGTVTGMIEVFNVMAVTGGGDAKSMAGGSNDPLSRRWRAWWPPSRACSPIPICSGSLRESSSC
ncbi:MAG: hypothetical protein CM15mP74_11790 [Halieaceae bacterium]|nr:MAG: hypothetical protein CM15mP74_11790 [Halieaceae bacterium]